MRMGFVFLVAIVLAAPVWAQQTTGAVSGTVNDQTGAAIAGAALTARNLATTIKTSTQTDETGIFRFPLLATGNYEITVEKAGFATLVQKNVVVTVGSHIDLTLTLTVAAAASTVTVSEETPLVETTRTQVSSTVNDKSVANLPVNGRNFIDFVLLTPGVTRDVRTGDISFAGQRGTLNSLTVDGTDDNNTFFGQTTGRTGSGRAPYQFSQDAVQEFQVNSSSYSAEYGKAGGAVINVITKSGTNDYHGTVFEFYRDRALNATDLINKNRGLRKGANHFHQFGGNVGGPIRKEKLFFFFDYDGQRTTQPNPVFLNPPTAFTPVTANEIAALNYLTARANSWIRTQDQNVYLVKGDWRINDSHQFAARWNHQRFTGGGFENGGPQNSEEHTGASLVSTDTLSFALTSSLNSQVVNVGRFSWSRDREPGQANSPNPEATVRQGGQTVLVVGRNFFSPRETTVERMQFSDTISWVQGRHNIKFGIDFVRDLIFNFFPGNFSGGYTFNCLENFGRSLAGQPLIVSAAQGCPAINAANPTVAADSLNEAFAGAGTTGPVTTPDIAEYSGFVQDEWRVTNNLTLNLGVRYDIQTVKQPGVLNPAASLAAAGIVTNHINVDSNNWGPRFGTAWTPFGNKKLVVRVGYGMFYGRTPSIMTGTAHSNNGINVQTRTFTGLTTPIIPSYPNNICGAPTASPSCPLPPTVTGSPPLIFAFSNDFVQPYVSQFSGGFEWEVWKDWSVGVNYIGVKGVHLPRTNDVNLNGASLSVVQIPINTTGELLTFQRYSTTRPIAGFGRLLVFQSTANSIYHGGTFQLTKRFSRNYQFVAAYTLGHVIDDTPDATAVVPGTSDDAKLVQFPTLPFGDRASGVNDQRHRFVLSGIWNLNYAHNLPTVPRYILGGWELSGIFTAQSGQPYSGLVAFDLNQDGTSRTDRAPGLPRNTFYLPSTYSLDPRVTRNFNVRESMKFQFIFEAFNIFNRANIFAVNTSRFARSTSPIAAPTGCGSALPALNPCLIPLAAFGTPTSTNNTPRIIQLAAKFIF